ncbi:glycosyltransferase family 2 protein [Parabacteroides timonensis]|uniref:glycosyltransferase family 2 protein n=1 Tax=Parabacteroides timonensis TaxID=1871013 RepID=UPI00094E8835|nr:glycosyltransferase family 2 protein [Parabacteroides timonensis]
MDVKVSIIIPVYNVASYLDTCLLSCVSQTFHDLEIIVVNDGSTDESPHIIKKYAEKDSRIRVITKENQGLVYARKSGLDIARGEYVFHLDGDDYLETNAIEELYNAIVKSGSDYVECNFYYVTEDNGYIFKEKVKSNSELDGLYGQELLYCILHHKKWFIWGKLMRKSLFDDVIYHPISIGEDLFFNMQICLKVKKTIVIDIRLYNYVSRSGSITNQDAKKVRMLKLDMVKYIYSLLDIYTYNQSIKDELYLKFYYFFLNCISHKETEVRTILYDYYWSKEEQKKFLWRKRKDFYFITSVFFQSPFWASLLANIYLLMVFLRRKYIRYKKRFKYNSKQ